MVKPALIYDGECGFCRRWARRWELSTGDRVEYLAYQELGKRFPEIPRQALADAVHYVDSSGTAHRGAAAVFALLGGWTLSAYRRLPGFAFVSEAVYGLVARNRPAASRLTLWLWGPSPEPSRHALGTAIFIRLLGLCYFAAFASLGAQILGLSGSGGLLPAASFLERAGQALGDERFRLLPTLFWLDASDAALRAACWAGAGAGLLVAAGLAPALLLPALWAVWLSLCVVGGDFMSFQWDSLLLEAGLLACLAAPPGLKPAPRDPPAAAHWLLRWLVFRLIFQSGAVKLLSGDAAWRDLTSLTYHYWTQPLPAWPAWYVHHLPSWLHKLSCAALFVLELAVPFLVLLPRRPRLLGALLLMSLQLAIAATGNYAYFNLLAAALCLALIDDASWTALLARLGRKAPGPSAAPPPRRWRWAAALLILLVSLAPLWAMFGGRDSVPAWLSRLQAAAYPLRSVNGYGLFAVMTKQRYELFIEGSDDGRLWKSYPFRWKPGDPARRPPFLAPHQPRLDWQMWFASLSRYQDNAWLTNLLARIVQGSPQALSLLAGNPFPDKPPRYLRVFAREYRFSTPDQRRATGSWWTVTDAGLYMPVVQAVQR